MDIIAVNYYAIITGAVISMVIGAVWYGTLFGNKWMEIIGADAADLEARKKMQKEAGPLYGIQFILTLFQITILAHLIKFASWSNGLEHAIWILAAFVIPTLAGAAMWNNEPGKLKRARFLIQSGYQLIMFLVYGLLLQFWQ